MEQNCNTHRKLLTAAVSSILLETGIDFSEKECLGTLTEMLQAFICEIGYLSKNYCELSGRIEPIIADVILGFVEMGFNFSDLDQYVKKLKHGVLPAPQPQQPQKQLSMLQAGTKQPLPSYIPPHLPPFPDPHAYIRTPTHKQPVIDYEAIREKAAAQKKDMERALTKFLAKTSQTHNLFESDEVIFPLIACKPTFPPYLSALLPQDQIFDPEDLEYDHKAQEEQPPKKRLKSERRTSEVKTENSDNEQQSAAMIKQEENTSSNWDIDNPYLAATKLPNKGSE